MTALRTGEGISGSRRSLDFDRTPSSASSTRLPCAMAELEVLRRSRDLASEIGDGVSDAWLGALRGRHTKGDELRLTSARRSGTASRAAAIDRLLAVDPSAVPVADETAVVKEAQMREVLRRHRVTLRALTARTSGPSGSDI